MPKGGMFFDIDTLSPGIKALPAFLDRAVEGTLRYLEPQAENWAKMNAPWTDQTTNARNGLFAQSGRERAMVHYLAIAHRVPYGIYLEVRFAGRNAIIMPTVYHFYGEAMRALNGILSKAGGSVR